MKSIGAHITGTMKRVARAEITGYMIASMKQSIKLKRITNTLYIFMPWGCESSQSSNLHYVLNVKPSQRYANLRQDRSGHS